MLLSAGLVRHNLRWQHLVVLYRRYVNVGGLPSVSTTIHTYPEVQLREQEHQFAVDPSA
jgi:hypothetical protein